MTKKNSLVILSIAAIVAVTGFALFFSARATIAEVPVALADDDSQTFFAVLGGGQEVPVTSSSAVGSALMTFNQDSNMLCFAISYTALTAPEVAAHFHSPAAIGVAVGPTFGIPFGSPKTGCVGTLSDQQADDLEDVTGTS